MDRVPRLCTAEKSFQWAVCEAACGRLLGVCFLPTESLCTWRTGQWSLSPDALHVQSRSLVDTVSWPPFMLNSCLSWPMWSSQMKSSLMTMAASSNPCSVQSPHPVWASHGQCTHHAHFSQTALRACDHTLPCARRASSDQPFHSEGPSSRNLCAPPLATLPHFHVSTHPTAESPQSEGCFFYRCFHKPHRRVHHSMVPCNKRGCFLFRSCCDA